jgi:hypothetical protein
MVHEEITRSSLLPLREKVDRAQREADEGYLSAIASAETYPSSVLRAAPPQGEKATTDGPAAYSTYSAGSTSLGLAIGLLGCVVQLA